MKTAKDYQLGNQLKAVFCLHCFLFFSRLSFLRFHFSRDKNEILFLLFSINLLLVMFAFRAIFFMRQKPDTHYTRPSYSPSISTRYSEANIAQIHIRPSFSSSSRFSQIYFQIIPSIMMELKFMCTMSSPCCLLKSFRSNIILQ